MLHRDLSPSLLRRFNPLPLAFEPGARLAARAASSLIAAVQFSAKEPTSTHRKNVRTLSRDPANSPFPGKRRPTSMHPNRALQHRLSTSPTAQNPFTQLLTIPLISRTSPNDRHQLLVEPVSGRVAFRWDRVGRRQGGREREGEGRWWLWGSSRPWDGGRAETKWHRVWSVTGSGRRYGRAFGVECLMVRVIRGGILGAAPNERSVLERTDTYSCSSAPWVAIVVMVLSISLSIVESP
jgi:hypothetical protein